MVSAVRRWVTKPGRQPAYHRAGGSNCLAFSILDIAQRIERRTGGFICPAFPGEIISARSLILRYLLAPESAIATGIIGWTAAPELFQVTHMRRLFAGTVSVHYGAMYFLGADADSAAGDESFEGQVNGLCGADMRTALFLRTGLHTGGVKVTVDFWDREPPLDDSWEEVVEASFVVNDPEHTGIMGWGGASWNPVDLRRGRYRVRYCARNMDAGRRKDTLLSDGEESVEEYSLSFWFVPAGAPDRLIRQTSETAAMWHQWAVDRISRESSQVAPLPYSQRTRSGAMVIAAKRIRVVAPTYPQKALEEGLSGSVTVDFIVDVNGEPTEVRIADANPSGTFDQAALEALRHWRYEPLRLEGVLTPIPDRVVFRFDPKSA